MTDGKSVPFFIAFALWLAATAVPANGAGPAIEIPAILSITGPAALLGTNEQAALELVADQVNKAGGIAGRLIKFDVSDDQSNAQVALQLFSSVSQKSPVVVGPSLSANCGAIAPLIKDGPVVYCLSPGVHPEKGSYMFSWGPDSRDLVVMNIRYYRELGLKKIAMLNSTDATGQDGERSLDYALSLPENKGLTLVAREHFANSDLTVSAQVSRIKQSGAQALIAWGTGTPIGTVFHGLSDAGLDIPVGVNSGNLIYPFMKQYADVLPKKLVSASFGAVAYDSLPAGAVKNASRQFVESFKAINVRPDLSQIIAWDPAWIIVNAYRKLGPSATSAQIHDYIGSLHDFAGATGMYDFRTASQRGILISQSGIMITWDPAKDSFVAISNFGGALR